MQVNDAKSVLQVTLPEGPVVTFHLDLDYPRQASNFALAQISGHHFFDSLPKAHRAIEVLKVQAQMEETRSARTVTEAVLFVQSKLLKMD